MERQIKIGGLYHHFKSPLNEVYKVLNVAMHTETEEDLVIYQQMFGDGKIFARPKDMFLSEVDRDKYPEAKQLYRLEEVGEDNKEFKIGNLCNIFENIEWISDKDKSVNIVTKDDTFIIHDGLTISTHDMTKVVDYNYIILVQLDFDKVQYKKPNLICKSDKVYDLYDEIIERFYHINNADIKNNVISIMI